MKKSHIIIQDFYLNSIVEIIIFRQNHNGKKLIFQERVGIDQKRISF